MKDYDKNLNFKTKKLSGEELLNKFLEERKAEINRNKSQNNMKADKQRVKAK